MGFTLRIKFMCLCFFVPDPRNKTMHVLMPATCRHNPGAVEVERHLASLMFPSPGGQLDSAGHIARDGDPHVNDFIDMGGWALELGGGGATLDVPEVVVDVTPLTGFVTRALLDNPHELVSSHVVLAGGGIEDAQGVKGLEWSFNNRQGPIAQSVVWKMEMKGDTLEWSRRSLTDGRVEPLPSIPAQNGAIELEFHHTTRECFPLPREVPTRSAEETAKHFAAFYSFFRRLQERPPVPRPVHGEEVLPRSCMAASGRLPDEGPAVAAA